MKISNKTSSETLWEIVKPLLVFGDELPIYKEVMDEDEDSVPSSYLLIRNGVVDRGRLYGDGKPVCRESDCDLILVSKSKGCTSSDLHVKNIERVKAALEAAECSFEGYNLGYNDTQKQSEYTWNVNLLYG